MPLILRLALVAGLASSSGVLLAQTATVASTVEASRSLDDREPVRTLGPSNAGARGEPRQFARVFVEMTIVPACHVASSGAGPVFRCAPAFEPRWHNAKASADMPGRQVSVVRQTVEY